MLLEGKKNSYEVIKEIGLNKDGGNIGSFGRIYQVKIIDDDSGKLYALKYIDLLKVHQISDKSIDECRERAEREYLAGLIIHQNIVHNHDTGFIDKSEQKIFHVMDYFPHGNLLDVINEKLHLKKHFTLLEIENICLQILLGLKELHTHGFRHRDLKPENILRDGNRFALADFGLCGFIASRITRGKMDGTFAFAPPEQKEEGRENEIILPSVDIYSFGVILYMLTTLRRPFGDDDNVSQWNKRQRNNAWDKIEAHRPEVLDPERPGEYDKDWKKIVDIIVRCLQNEIKFRFKDVNEILNILRPEIITYQHEKKTKCKADDPVWISILNSENHIKPIYLNGIMMNKNSNVFTIGRDVDGIKNDINPNPRDRYISRKHATIERNKEKDGFFFIDGQCFNRKFIGSMNGSALNGDILETGIRYPLSYGDEIIIGDTSMIVIKPDS
jgi:serine/threonine protein kinase